MSTNEMPAVIPSMLGKIRTVCKGCIFAIYEDKTQTGCKLGQLEKLKAAGAEILEVYDDEKEFYLIEDRVCMWCRSKEWGEKHQKQNWEADARIEMRIQYQVIIVANDSLDDLKKTLESIKQQVLPPKHITVLRKFGNNLLPGQIIPLLRDLKDIKWRLQNMLEPEEESETPYIDQILNFVHAQYYSVFNAGYILDKYLFSRLDTKIHNDMFKFAIISPDENGNGMIVPYSIHKYYVGNVVKPLEEKIREDECNNLITTFKSIFQ